jgi:acyl-CoA synthetase (AMP-forming)/AMP-acid ligase II
VRDAVVVGLPDDRFGEVVTAVVEPEPGATVDRAAIDARVRADLAGYKAPRHLVVVPTIGRAPNGKADYRRLRREAAAAVGVPLR